MAYIKRDLESKIQALSKEYACILITGSRQVGKTTVLKQLMKENRRYVTRRRNHGTTILRTN